MYVRKLVLGLGAAGILASTVLLTSGSSIVTAQPEGRLRVIAVTTEESTSPVEAVGDSFAWGGDVFAVRRGGGSHVAADRRDPIGRFGVECTVTSWENAETQCLATVSLDDDDRGRPSSDRRRGDDEGQITVQGLISQGSEEEMNSLSDRRRESIVLAITGGTDDFENAGGELRVREISDTVELLTFDFSD